MDNVELLRQIHAPFERGEAEDYQPIWDIVDDDVIYESPVGTIIGRDAMIEYFTKVAELIEFSPFEAPIQYLADGDGDRVAMTSEEHVRDPATGAGTRGEWVWLIDMVDGKMAKIVHFLHFEDPALLIDACKQAYARTVAPARG